MGSKFDVKARGAVSLYAVDFTTPQFQTFAAKVWDIFPPNCTLACKREQCDSQRKVKGVTRLTSLSGSPREICSWSSFCSSFRAPIDCWFLAKSESSFSPASVKYLEKCSQLRLLAGNSSWESAHISRQSIRSLLFIYIESSGCHD